MIKVLNYAGEKVLARFKTGTSRRKLRGVRQPIVIGTSPRMRPHVELGNEGSFTRTFPPATLYHYGHELNSQTFLAIYFAHVFFATRNFASTFFAS